MQELTSPLLEPYFRLLKQAVQHFKYPGNRNRREHQGISVIYDHGLNAVMIEEIDGRYGIVDAYIQEQDEHTPPLYYCECQAQDVDGLFHNLDNILLRFIADHQPTNWPNILTLLSSVRIEGGYEVDRSGTLINPVLQSAYGFGYFVDTDSKLAKKLHQDDVYPAKSLASSHILAVSHLEVGTALGRIPYPTDSI